MDKVNIGEGAVVKRAIIDKNVKVPAGAAIGLDPELDRARGFKVTDSGITVLSKGQLVPEPGEAERALSAANLILVPDAVTAATENWPATAGVRGQGGRRPGRRSRRRPRRRVAEGPLSPPSSEDSEGGSPAPASGRAPRRL